jgi:crotonobetainyl-CoA:carnitine CoA-transferase CaiB-like acyl-CoA transferase
VSTSHPLQGITVLEIGHTVAAPYAGMILAELGADVIKVETPERETIPAACRPTGRQVLGLPGVEPGASEASASISPIPFQAATVRKLIVDRVDVILHNLKFGAMAKRGFGAPELLALKPALVYCNIGAFGAVGPMRNRPGYDPLVQAFGGLMSIMGEDGRPPVRVGVSITDMAAGLWSVIGIQAACFERERTGRGASWIRLSSKGLAWLAYHFSAYFVSGAVPKREGSGLAQIVPYQAFATADAYIMVAVGNDNLFRKFCVALERDELAGGSALRDEQGALRKPGRAHSHDRSDLRDRAGSEWLRRLGAQDVPCSPINTIDQVLEEPQTKALGMFQTSPDGKETLLGLRCRSTACGRRFAEARPSSAPTRTRSCASCGGSRDPSRCGETQDTLHGSSTVGQDGARDRRQHARPRPCDRDGARARRRQGAISARRVGALERARRGDRRRRRRCAGRDRSRSLPPDTPSELCREATSKLGRIDILVNAAGGSRTVPGMPRSTSGTRE